MVDAPRQEDPAELLRSAGSSRELRQELIARQYERLARGDAEALALARQAERRLRTDPLVRVRADIAVNVLTIATHQQGAAGLDLVDRDNARLAAAIALLVPERITASAGEATARQAVAYALLQVTPDLPRRVGDLAPVAAQFIATLDALGFEVRRKEGGA